MDERPALRTVVCAVEQVRDVTSAMETVRPGTSHAARARQRPAIVNGRTARASSRPLARTRATAT